ncbi:efflux RND transporter permease subunit [Candidatus Contubernalis alkaliaceticus]|uniref:efflux RND transporter permease subunit n=1 Tax=Candidatus Contubernalis alkaliaceticus TaxID=338645 RepID=UPI001F4BDC7B|nr:efflux RND transporter permease subunit [Candidatus Contubernalis alkalaceticus]UNC91367.1 efflux RND transporter permease subunit [Candidatus Contubernalis alkalaceticus]
MFSKYSVKRPYTVLVAVVLVMVLGIVSFTGMTTDLLPEMELPYIVVITAYPGASPEQVELMVTRPLESALGTAGGLNNISSISNENSSIIILEFSQSINMDSAMIELSNNLDMVSAQLDSAVGKSMLMRINPDMMPIMIATADIEGKEVGEVSDFVKDVLLPSFERINGVASVSASGLLEEAIRVSLNQEKIDALNEKIMEDLDQTLDETKAQLDEAQRELAAARKQLEAETDNQKNQLAEASAQVDGVIANLNALLAEETLLNSQQFAFEQEKQGLSQLVPLNELFSQAFPGGVSAIPPEMYELVIIQLSSILPDQLTGLSQSEMVEMEKMAAAAPGRIAAIETELQNISVRLMTISAMKPQLEQGLAEATSGYQQIESGKMTLSIELAKAQMQLENGEKELKEGLQEFQDARDELRKKVDLNSFVTVEMVSNILKAQNFSMPAGYIQGGEGHLVKVGDQYDSKDSLKNTILFSLDSVGDIGLSDIAEVVVTDNSAETYAKVNGNDSVMMTFQKQSTASTADVAGRINETIDELSKEYPGLRILPLMDQGEYINMSIDSVLQNLLLGSLLAIIVLFFFLKDIRPTLIIACSIPVSLLFAVTLMYFSNVTLNIISLSGLALGVGMLVDNSIVVIENIYRMRNEGIYIYEAAVQGAKQVTGAIFASTLTTVCVFLPIVFTHGISRQIFSDMGLTIAYSLVASLIVALTLIPTMASTLLKTRQERKQRWFDIIVNSYEKLLHFSLNYKAVVLTLVVMLLGLSIYGVTVMGTSFMPAVDSPQMSATFTMPEGSTTEELYEMSDEVMTRILEIDAVENVGASAGSSGALAGLGGGLTGSSSESSSFYILLKDDRSITNLDVERLIFEKLQDLEGEVSVSASNMDMSVLGGSGVEVIIKGNDLDVLSTAAEEVAELLRGTEGTADVVSGNEDAGIETRISVDKDAAMKEGLTVAQVYQEIAAVLSGETQATTLTTAQQEYQVIVVGAESIITRDNISDYTFTVKGEDGEDKVVRLGDIARITEADTPSSISRDSQSRYVTVSASIQEGYNIGLVSRDFERKLVDYTPPVGVTLDTAGENEMINSAISDLILMIALAVIFIYLIMVAQFQSLLSPFIILFTLPLAFTGGLLLLWVSGMELSVTAMLGFLVLAGIVVNNGIVFVDYVNQLRLEGKEKREALISTGIIRIRPILMTALTTILAMSAMALGIGSGAEMTQAMAVVTIGGLTYATLLTLLVVPIMYDILHQKPMIKIDIQDQQIDTVN